MHVGDMVFAFTIFLWWLLIVFGEDQNALELDR